MAAKKSIGDRIFNSFNFLIMAIVFVIVVYPFIYMLSSSLSNALYLRGGLLIFPRRITLETYKTILKNPDVLRYAFISISRSVLGTAITILITSMAGYALSKGKVPGIKLLRKLIVFTMYFGLGLIPVYLLVRFLGLVGTFWVYIIPSLASVFGIVLVRAYVEQLPPSLEEAALMDGASEFQSFWRIVFPMCLPVVAALSLFTFVGHWNAYFDTLLYNFANRELFTLQYYLYMMLTSKSARTLMEANEMGQRQQAGVGGMISTKTLTMAMTVISTLPILVVFPFLRKYIKSGLLLGSIKG
jgi:putative aldouronate transport system permease protein